MNEKKRADTRPSSWPPTAIVLIASMLVPLFAGCAGDTKAPAQQQQEEQRQKLIKNAERMQRET